MDGKEMFETELKEGKIYVVSHKHFEMISGADEGYQAIYVGDAHDYAHRGGVFDR